MGRPLRGSRRRLVARGLDRRRRPGHRRMACIRRGKRLGRASRGCARHAHLRPRRAARHPPHGFASRPRTGNHRAAARPDPTGLIVVSVKLTPRAFPRPVSVHASNMVADTEKRISSHDRSDRRICDQVRLVGPPHHLTRGVDPGEPGVPGGLGDAVQDARGLDAPSLAVKLLRAAQLDPDPGSAESSTDQ